MSVECGVEVGLTQIKVLHISTSHRAAICQATGIFLSISNFFVKTYFGVKIGKTCENRDGANVCCGGCDDCG